VPLFFITHFPQRQERQTVAAMARTKFTFEKRQREIARQQKQKDKAARRAEARQSKDETEPALQGETPGTGDLNGNLPGSAENPGHGEDVPR
jgi:hypothetical protein